MGLYNQNYWAWRGSKWHSWVPTRQITRPFQIIWENDSFSLISQVWKRHCGCGNVGVTLKGGSRLREGGALFHWDELPSLPEVRQVSRRWLQCVRWLLSSHSCLSQVVLQLGFSTDMTLFYCRCQVVEVITGSFIVLEFWVSQQQYALCTFHGWLTPNLQLLVLRDRNVCILHQQRCPGGPRCCHIFMTGSYHNSCLSAVSFWFLQHVMHKT